MNAHLLIYIVGYEVNKICDECHNLDRTRQI